MILSDYEQKVYAGWLGKCIGVRFGAPVENWTYDQIRSYLGEIEDYLPIPEGKIFQPDDDTSVPLVLLRVVEDYGPDFTPEQAGQTLLNYLGDQHGSLWWGGYGVSTEHTAYLNLKAGIPAPQSGSALLNGKNLSEQIGGQIFSDIWGLLAPGDPARAAGYAERASSVTHDGEGVLGGRFIAALVAASFTSSRPEDWIAAGLDVLPPTSEYARLVQALQAFHTQHPEDWRAGYEYLRANFGYDRYPGIVPIIPNAGVIVLGLLYGQGDFSRTICIGNMAGWDTDCNVGNLGAILGVAVGLNGIPARWRTPLNDRLAAASLVGAANLVDISSTAHRIASLGLRLAGEAELPPVPKAGFDLPGATHGFSHTGEQRNILLLSQAEIPGGNALRAIVRLLKKKQEMRLFQETYWHRDRLVSDYYGAGYSPTLYPGQRMKARLYLPPGSPTSLLAALYVQDGRSGASLQSQAVTLQPGEWHTLEWRIPPLNSALLTQAGLVFRNLGPETWKGEFLLDDFDWNGRPEWAQEFGQVQPAYGAIAGWTFWRGYWRVEDGALLGSGSEPPELYTGSPEWTDLEATLRLTPLAGRQHGLLLRVGGAQRSLFAGLFQDGAAIIKKTDAGAQVVKAAPFAWSCGTSYTLTAQLEGQRLRLAVDGQPVLEWADPAPVVRGQIGLAAAPAGCTRFHTLAVR